MSCWFYEIYVIWKKNQKNRIEITKKYFNVSDDVLDDADRDTELFLKKNYKIHRKERNVTENNEWNRPICVNWTELMKHCWDLLRNESLTMFGKSLLNLTQLRGKCWAINCGK